MMAVEMLERKVEVRVKKRRVGRRERSWLTQQGHQCHSERNHSLEHVLS